jgi:toluene monooxygenase system ferredoxin subunit
MAVEQMTTKQALKACQVFQGLTDERLEKVAEVCSQETHEVGSTVFHAGAMAQHVYVLVDGKVALQMESPVGQMQLRKRVTVDTIGKGELFGWSGLVEPYSYTMSAICLRASTVLAIDAQKLSTLLQDDCPIAYEVLQGLTGVISSRLHDTLQLLVTERSLT